MSNRAGRGEFFFPWMEGVARHIQDPVARLRFLRVAAPCVQSGSARPAQRPILILLLSLAAIACLIIVLVVGSGRFATVPAGPKAGATTQPATTMDRSPAQNSAK
jgi:hypothetical protein